MKQGSSTHRLISDRSVEAEAEQSETARVGLATFTIFKRYWSFSMHKMHLAGAGMLACALATLGSNLARAEPPQSAAYYEPKTPFVICDTRDQIMQVLDAVRAHKLKDKLDEFAKAAGPKNEPGCLYGDVGPILFGASEHVGVLFDNDGAINLWVSHVGNRRGEFYLLWGEVGKETSV
jgi:hypothetical protein